MDNNRLKKREREEAYQAHYECRTPSCSLRWYVRRCVHFLADHARRFRRRILWRKRKGEKMYQQGFINGEDVKIRRRKKRWPGWIARRRTCLPTFARISKDDGEIHACGCFDDVLLLSVKLWAVDELQRRDLRVREGLAALYVCTQASVSRCNITKGTEKLHLQARRFSIKNSPWLATSRYAPKARTRPAFFFLCYSCALSAKHSPGKNCLHRSSTPLCRFQPRGYVPVHKQHRQTSFLWRPWAFAGWHAWARSPRLRPCWERLGRRCFVRRARRNHWKRWRRNGSCWKSYVWMLEGRWPKNGGCVG